jgi:3-mercaptopyruvate sulfurtransferase SseA
LLIVAEVGTALQRSENDFKLQFGFDKPSKDDELVFYCKAGIRAMSGAEQAASLGYKSFCYTGSWTDWASHCKSDT